MAQPARQALAKFQDLQPVILFWVFPFLFIPPNLPHQPVNLSQSEAAQAIVVRNDPDEQEHVILYDPNRNIGED